MTSACCAKSLRAFFRYAEKHGWCADGIAEAIESPRIFKQEALPTGLDWDNVQKLLTSTDSDRPRDIRDRAILMLLSVYGFRSGEIDMLNFIDAHNTYYDAQANHQKLLYDGWLETSELRYSTGQLLSEVTP